jgi:hypothetical protein
VTRDRIDDFFDQQRLNDRERLSWAYQTEARVRLEKVETRGALDISTTLDSDNLFEVYPKGEEDDIKENLSALARDREAFRRMCHPAFTESREPDDSFQSIYALDVSSHERDQNCLTMDEGKGKASSKLYRKAPVPANLLFFRLILEAFMGYNEVSFRMQST